jgi:hypothetical protein
MVRADVRELERAVERFRSETGQSPRGLEQLVAAGYIDRLPRDPDGRDYAYEPATGRVLPPAGRVLGVR